MKAPKFMRSSVYVLSAVLLSGCFGSNDVKPLQSDNTLADLLPIHVSATSDVPEVSSGMLVKTYKNLLSHVDEPQIRYQILSRVSVLQMQQQDQKLQVSEEQGGELYEPDYTEAIATIKQTLAEFPDQIENDYLYYYLAKAYDLRGDSANALAALTQLVESYPQSAFYIESQYRRGDYLFSAGNYRESLLAFSAVTESGAQSAIHQNAVYMLGWSQFKVNSYDPAAISFTKVLDNALPASGDINQVAASQKTMVNDTLRVLGIIFSYLDGADSIAAVFQEIGPRTYEPVLYEGLADLYISQERYRDAIKTLKAYININPYGEKAPRWQNRIVTTMQQARFYKEAFDAKQAFIEQYAMDGDYYRTADKPTREYLDSYLYVYIDELARFYHAKAQKQKKALAFYREPPPVKKREMLADYQEAINYYERFIATFPNDWHAPEKTYMVAEAYAELDDYQQAKRFYERAAYDYGVHNYSEDAAYASILSYEKLLARAPAEEKDMMIQRKLAAQVASAKNFAFSKYSRPVMLDSIDMMFTQKDYVRAIEQAERFLNLKPEPDVSERLPISLVLAHSLYETEQYAKAEKAYYQALEIMPANDKRRTDLVDRVAASVYKQAEALAKEGKKIEAVDQLLRVGEISPTSKYRQVAEFDAASYLLQAEQWQRSLDVLTDYRKRYDPKREDLEVVGKMIAAYEGLEQLEKAADELQYVVDNATDPEKKRQALYLSAEYYERAGNDKKALAMFKRYTRDYPKPYDLAMETRFRLSEMYRKADDGYRRRYWLDKIIVADANAGSERNDRSKYLAAYSRNVFAKDYMDEFVAIELTQPLPQAIKKKRVAMELVLKKYQQVMDYEVQEFSTQSTYNVASIYSQMSKSLLDSERPKGFSELELQQYTLLLEEQAYPLEETSIDIHETNVQNSWNGNYDRWVGKSIEALSKLLPGQYDKKESLAGYSDVIY